MNRAIHHVRMENMKRAKDVWRLTMDGMKPDDIAKQLSATTYTVNKILKHTTFNYYLEFTEKQSYYDTQLMIKLQITNERGKLQLITNSIARKKKIFLRIFEATAILIVFLILV